MSEQGLIAFTHPMYGMNLVCCILCALPKVLFGVNIVGINCNFNGTPQVKSIVLGMVMVVAMTRESSDHGLFSSWDNACLTTFVWPDKNVLAYHYIQATFLVCAV